MTTKERVIKAKILKGLDLAKEKLVKSKQERNYEFVVSEEGKVVKLNAYEVEF